MPAEGALRDGNGTGFDLIETLRWEPGAGFVRLDRHLARLARSAAVLSLPGAERAKDALPAALPASDTPLRVRLELFPDGRIERAADADSLAARAIGVRLPVESLAWWIRASPHARSPYASSRRCR